MSEDELLELKKSGKCDSLKYCNPPIELGDFQAVSLALWFEVKRGVFMFDPGMGKTITIGCGLKILHLARTNMKTLFFIKNSQMKQTKADIESVAGLRTVVTNGTKKSLLSTLRQDLTNIDVVMVTHEVLRSEWGRALLYANLHKFNITIVDEAHNISNYKNSDASWTLNCLLNRMEYVALLTATPLRSRVEQVADILYMVDNNKFYRTLKIAKELKALPHGKSVDDLYPLNVYNYTREDVGIESSYNFEVLWCMPHDFQREVKYSPKLLKTTRGEGSFNQYHTMIGKLKEQLMLGKRGIVFVYYHSTWDYLYPLLCDEDFRFGRIDGLMSNTDKQKVQDSFNREELDLVFISVSEAINLDCDFVFLYEFTDNLKQILGRGERGLKAKTLDVYLPLTKDTGEAELFVKSVYLPSKLIRQVVGKSYTEFLELGTELM